MHLKEREREGMCCWLTRDRQYSVSSWNFLNDATGLSDLNVPPGLCRALAFVPLRTGLKCRYIFSLKNLNK